MLVFYCSLFKFFVHSFIIIYNFIKIYINIYDFLEIGNIS